MLTATIWKSNYVKIELLLDFSTSFLVFMQNCKNRELWLLVHPLINQFNCHCLFALIWWHKSSDKLWWYVDQSDFFGALNQFVNTPKLELPRKAKILTCFGKVCQICHSLLKLWQICHSLYVLNKWMNIDQVKALIRLKNCLHFWKKFFTWRHWISDFSHISKHRNWVDFMVIHFLP